jgi:hypothetical protein
MDREQYEAHFANGDVQTANSLEHVRNAILLKADHDQAPPGLFPVEIWLTGPVAVKEEPRRYGGERRIRRSGETAPVERDDPERAVTMVQAPAEPWRYIAW